MGRISEIKMQVRHKEWAAILQECQASGKRVDVWCQENGINVSTCYKRLSMLRTELIDGAEKQSIVPVSVSAAIMDAAEAVVPDTAGSDMIVMRKNGIEIELPQNISEDTILALRGLGVVGGYHQSPG